MTNFVLCPHPTPPPLQKRKSLQFLNSRPSHPRGRWKLKVPQRPKQIVSHLPGYVYLYMYISICMCIFMYVYGYLSIHLSIHHLSIYLSIYLSIHTYIHIYIYIYITNFLTPTWSILVKKELNKRQIMRLRTFCDFSSFWTKYCSSEYMQQSSKQCALLVTTAMALWQLLQLGIWKKKMKKIKCMNCMSFHKVSKNCAQVHEWW